MPFTQSRKYKYIFVVVAVPAILKNPPRVQRRPRMLRVAPLISRVDKIRDTDLKL